MLEILERAQAHRLTVVTKDGSKDPVSERLESNKGGGVDILGMDMLQRASLVETANLHNAYEASLANAKHTRTKMFCEQGLKSTNAKLPTEVQDSSHNQ
jgi:hypothetical protein